MRGKDGAIEILDNGVSVIKNVNAPCRTRGMLLVFEECIPS